MLNFLHMYYTHYLERLCEVNGSQDCVFGVSNGHGLEGSCLFPGRKKFSFHLHPPKMALGPNRPPSRCVQLCAGVQCNILVKNDRSYVSTVPYVIELL